MVEPRTRWPGRGVVGVGLMVLVQASWCGRSSVGGLPFGIRNATVADAAFLIQKQHTREGKDAMGVTRIAPVEPPYEPEVEEQLRSMMPEGVPPIALFRTFVRNLSLSKAMHPWGRHELSRALSVGLRAREIVIDRTCARCGCEYEWGVHVAFFAQRAGLDEEQVRWHYGTPERHDRVRPLQRTPDQECRNIPHAYRALVRWPLTREPRLAANCEDFHH